MFELGKDLLDEGAQLQGASLEGAELQGASLKKAELQGASFYGAGLQGALLDLANLKATELSGSLLWRATSRKEEPAQIGAIRLRDAKWGPLGKEAEYPFF